jgi:hypothetical protein
VLPSKSGFPACNAATQGEAIPYSFGFYLVCHLVAALNPTDLDALDESVPFTKANPAALRSTDQCGAVCVPTSTRWKKGSGQPNQPLLHTGVSGGTAVYLCEPKFAVAANTVWARCIVGAWLQPRCHWPEGSY